MRPPCLKLPFLFPSGAPPPAPCIPQTFTAGDRQGDRCDNGISITVSRSDRRRLQALLADRDASTRDSTHRWMKEGAQFMFTHAAGPLALARASMALLTGLWIGGTCHMRLRVSRITRNKTEKLFRVECQISIRSKLRHRHSLSSALFSSSLN